MNGLPGHASKCNGVVKSPESRFPPPHVATRKYEGGIYTWTSQGRENNHFWDASCVRSSLGSSSVTQGQAPRRSPACSTRSRFVHLPCASDRPTDRSVKVTSAASASARNPACANRSSPPWPPKPGRSFMRPPNRRELLTLQFHETPPEKSIL